MKTGDIVTIYESHLTKEYPEGRAKLIKRILSTRDSDRSENWKVQFVSDGFKCERMVSL